jgi:hypothetical protein
MSNYRVKDMAREVSALVDKALDAIQPKDFTEPDGDTWRGLTILQSTIFSLLLHNIQKLTASELVSTEDGERLSKAAKELAVATKDALSRHIDAAGSGTVH